jgi:hypothetical protein
MPQRRENRHFAQLALQPRPIVGRQEKNKRALIAPVRNFNLSGRHSRRKDCDPRLPRSGKKSTIESIPNAGISQPSSLIKELQLGF